MPGRTTPLVNNEIYHIFNRGVASQPTFFDKRDYKRTIETIFYYQNANLSIKYSRFLAFSSEEKQIILKNQRTLRDFLVEIISLCLMPNHFHLLLKQLRDNGISKFMSNFTNSYTRYLNTKIDRTGPVFEGKFKSVRIETQNQLLHVSRYIHLNPYTSFVVKSLKDLEFYPYSSLPAYIGFINASNYSREIIMGNFKNEQKYKEFVFDQAGYQKLLHRIQHLILE